MAFIRSDIVLYGKHGNILRTLTENGIFTSGADGFVKSALVGLYHGKKSEPENTQENKIEIDESDRETKLLELKSLSEETFKGH